MDGPRAVVAGGSGFIGTALIKSLRDDGYSVQSLSRNPRTEDEVFWDGETIGEWQCLLEGASLVVNLSGETIGQKWTEEARERIRESRVRTTLAMGGAIARCAEPPRSWLNASAAGYYGDRGSDIVTEESSAGEGFLAETCVEWERAMLEAVTPGTRKRIVRTGIALGRGGALDPLIKLTGCFLGGRAGSGRQYMPWIHLADLIALMRWLVDQDQVQIANGTAPDPATNDEFMRELRRAMHRPWSPPVPAFAIRLVGRLLGPDADLILGGCRAVPKAALDGGFQFKLPELRPALEEAVRVSGR